MDLPFVDTGRREEIRGCGRYRFIAQDVNCKGDNDAVRSDQVVQQFKCFTIVNGTDGDETVKSQHCLRGQYRVMELIRNGFNPDAVFPDLLDSPEFLHPFGYRVYGDRSGHDTPVGLFSTETAPGTGFFSVSYTHLRAHETDSYLVCRLL